MPPRHLQGRGAGCRGRRGSRALEPGPGELTERAGTRRGLDLGGERADRGDILRRELDPGRALPAAWPSRVSAPSPASSHSSTVRTSTARTGGTHGDDVVRARSALMDRPRHPRPREGRRLLLGTVRLGVPGGARRGRWLPRLPHRRQAGRGSRAGDEPRSPGVVQLRQRRERRRRRRRGHCERRPGVRASDGRDDRRAHGGVRRSGGRRVRRVAARRAQGRGARERARHVLVERARHHRRSCFQGVLRRGVRRGAQRPTATVPAPTPNGRSTVVRSAG